MRAALAMLVILAAIALTLFFGTIQAMEKGSPSAQFQIFVTNDQPTNCAVRVIWPSTNAVLVSNTGEAVIERSRAFS